MTDEELDPIAAAREEFAGAGVPRSDQPTPGEQPGDTIDRYKLLQEIGEGGMGTVWMAEQSEPVRRRVALKIIKLGMDTKEVVARFEAERQALALMDHPNIATVLDGGATEQGRPYFVMELVKGVPITDYCDQAGLGITSRLELFIDVCGAIQHAHQKGVIHRDIKPGNVMVTLHDGVAVPKVIDFGIAKATSAELTQRTMFTQYAQMIGTPEYMAPEQAELSGLDIDTRADVYSLGVLLYEVLTGTKPFDLRDVLERGFEELLRTIREEDPAKPSTRVSTLGQAASPIAQKRHIDPSRLSHDLRGDLDWIVMKALSKDRTRRYETATGFALDVRRFLDREPVLAAPPSATYRLRKFLERRRKSVAAAATMLALLVAGSVGTGVGWYRTNRANRDLADANAQVEARAAELERVAEFQAAQLERIDPAAIGDVIGRGLLDRAGDRREAMVAALRGVNLTDVTVEALEGEFFTPTIQATREHFADQPVLQARLLRTLAEVLAEVGLFDTGLEVAAEARALSSELHGASSPEVIECLLLESQLHYLSDSYDEAIFTAREAFDLAVEALPEGDRLRSRARSALGWALSWVDRSEAFVHLEEALDEQRAWLGNEDGDTLETQMNLALALSRTAEPERCARAAELYEQAFGARERAGEATISEKQNLGMILMSLPDRRDEARDILLDAVQWSTDHLGREHRGTFIAAFNLAMALQISGEFEAALEQYERVLADVGDLRWAGDANFVRAAWGRAMTLYELGRHAEARAEAGELADLMEGTELEASTLGRELIGQLAVWTRAVNPVRAERLHRRALAHLSESGHDYERFLALAGIAQSLVEQGRLFESIEYFLASREVGVFTKNTYAFQLSGWIGIAYASVGDGARAIEWLETSLAEAEAELGPDSREVAMSAENLALVVAAADPERAEALHLRTLEILEGQSAADDLQLLQARKRYVGFLFARERYTDAEANARLCAEAAVAGVTSGERAKADLYDYGRILAKLGRTAEAGEWLQRAIDRGSVRPGADDALTVDAMRERVLALRSEGDAATAIPLLEQIVEWDVAHAPDGPMPIAWRYSLAGAYRALERHEEALAHSAAAFDYYLENSTVIRGGEEPLGEHVRTLEELDRIDDAAEAYLRIAERVRHEPTAGALELADCLAVSGHYLLEAERFEDAVPVLRECLELRTEHIPDDWLRYNAMSYLGHALSEVGQYEEAEPLLIRAYEELDPPEASLGRKELARERIIEHFERTGNEEAAARYR